MSEIDRWSAVPFLLSRSFKQTIVVIKLSQPALTYSFDSVVLRFQNGWRLHFIYIYVNTSVQRTFEYSVSSQAPSSFHAKCCYLSISRIEEKWYGQLNVESIQGHVLILIMWFRFLLASRWIPDMYGNLRQPKSSEVGDGGCTRELDIPQSMVGQLTQTWATSSIGIAWGQHISGRV